MSDFRVVFDINKKYLGDIMDAVAEFPMDNFSISKVKESKPSAAVAKSLSKILSDQKKPKSNKRGYISTYAQRGMLPVNEAILDILSHATEPMNVPEIRENLAKLGYHKATVITAFWRIKRQGHIKESGNSYPQRYMKAA